jgi:hypothetical protein
MSELGIERTSWGLRISFIILALVSPFIFPWQVTGVLAFIAALVFPPLAIFIGILIDVLYHAAGSLWWGTIAGLILCGIAYLVRYVFRARIM